jgi:hypothetical protein
MTRPPQRSWAFHGLCGRLSRFASALMGQRGELLMHQSQLTVSQDLRPLSRFRPLATMGITFVSWALGCALANDPKDGAKSGLQAGGPVIGCFLSAKIDCPLRCSEIDFDAVCDATLGAACDGQCGAEATGTCLDSCNADCAIGCNANGDVTCQNNCDDRCGENCRTLCAGAWNADQCSQTCHSQCDSSCAGNCQKNVDSSCDGKCDATCNATCSVEAHVACQIRCSVDGFTTCKARVAAQCVAECSSAVALTCSDDPSLTQPPQEVPVGQVPKIAPAAQPWHFGAADKAATTPELARFAPRPSFEDQPIAPPPLVPAPSEVDASSGVKPLGEENPQRGSDGERHPDRARGGDPNSDPNRGEHGGGPGPDDKKE